MKFFRTLLALACFSHPVVSFAQNDSCEIELEQLVRTSLIQQDSIRAQQDYIYRLLDEMEVAKKRSAEQLYKLRRENETLRKIMKSYVMQIDSLNMLNLQLEYEVSKLGEAAAKDSIERFPARQAQFPEGPAAMMRFINDHLVYPELSYADFPGKIIVLFVVEKDGSLENIRIVRSSGNAAWDRNCTELIAQMPKWEPALNASGEPVRSEVAIPIQVEPR